MIHLRQKARRGGAHLASEPGRPLPRWAGWLFLPASLIWLEALVKLRGFGTVLTVDMLRTALFSIPVALLGLALGQLWGRKGALRCAAVWLGLFTLACMIQTVYYTIFQTFASLYSASGLGDVMQGFFVSMLLGIWRSMPYLAPEALPLAALLLLRRRLDFTLPRRGLGAVAAAACLCQAAAVLWTMGSTGGAVSPRYVYAESFVLDKAVEDFGVMTTLRLDTRQLLGDYALFLREDEPAAEIPPPPEEPEEPDRPEEPEEPVYGDNVLPIDFAALAAAEEDETLRDMHEYFGSLTPTAQNAYTGRFAGKNLILITAEAFCSYAVDETLTPTLYRLANSGVVCRNFYNPLWWVSTYDGEYAVCTSLIPKSGVWSLYRSANNALPFCLGNQFRARGYRTLAYHDHDYAYYNRDVSHPHMGYDYKGIGNGLELPFNGWPRSDLEMMEVTVPEYVNGEEPFHIYYLTVSGHLEYNFLGNSMAMKNKSLVADLPYSEACRAYLACQIELDRALESLLDQLEAAGQLEDTVIALSGDHYPYGLTHEEISEFLGHPVDPVFELHKSTLILWSADLEEPVYVDKPCSSLDVLPTLSNLFGLPYDSRLMMGRDILSDAPGLVVLSDRSWITDLGRYDADQDLFTPAEGAREPEGYVETVMAAVNDKFTYSTRILEQDYYGKLGLTDGWQEVYAPAPRLPEKTFHLP